MAIKKHIVRNHIHFVVKDKDPGIIHVSLGDPEDPESEHIMAIHESFIPDIIAGLTGLKFVKS